MRPSTQRQPVDLSQVPVVDHHCHGLYRDQGPLDLLAWRRLFTESADAGVRREHVATTLFYQRLLRQLATFFDCEAAEDAVLAARAARPADQLIATLLRAANVEALLIDQGYPPREQVRPDAEVAALVECRSGAGRRRCCASSC